jgi:hypothetical protein
MPGKYLNIEEVKTKLELICLQYGDICECELIQLPYATSGEKNTDIIKEINNNDYYEITGIDNDDYYVNSGVKAGVKDCWAIRIKAGFSTPRHGILMIGGVHGEEWGSTDILVYFVESMLQAYHDHADLVLGSKTYLAAEVKEVLESLEIFVVPLVNPDGRAFSYSEGLDEWNRDRNLWRKNRTATTTPDYGVDLNRNYDWLFDYKAHMHQDTYNGNRPCELLNGGISDDPKEDNYQGPSAFSEPETRNVEYLLNQYPNIRFFVDVHCATELGLIGYPWFDDDPQNDDFLMDFRNESYNEFRGIRQKGTSWFWCPGCDDCASQLVAPLYREYMAKEDEERYKEIGKEMVSAIQAVRGTVYEVRRGNQLVWYSEVADAIDYAFSRHKTSPESGKVDALVIEWGPYGEWLQDWPECTNKFQPLYEEPPGIDRMTPVILDVSAGLTALCKTALRVPLIRLTPNPLDFGMVVRGGNVQRCVSLTNLSTQHVKILWTKIEPTSPAPVVKIISANAGVMVTPGQSETLLVGFSPVSDVDDIEAQLLVGLQYETESIIQDVRSVKLHGMGDLVSAFYQAMSFRPRHSQDISRLETLCHSEFTLTIDCPQFEALSQGLSLSEFLRKIRVWHVQSLRITEDHRSPMTGSLITSHVMIRIRTLGNKEYKARCRIRFTLQKASGRWYINAADIQVLETEEI